MESYIQKVIYNRQDSVISTPIYRYLKLLETVLEQSYGANYEQTTNAMLIS